MRSREHLFWICAAVWIAAAFPRDGAGLHLPESSQERPRPTHENVPPPGSRGAAQAGEVEDLFRKERCSSKEACGVPAASSIGVGSARGCIHHYLAMPDDG
jgi:hypothetical protein